MLFAGKFIKQAELCGSLLNISILKQVTQYSIKVKDHLLRRWLSRMPPVRGGYCFIPVSILEIPSAVRAFVPFSPDAAHIV